MQVSSGVPSLFSEISFSLHFCSFHQNYDHELSPQDHLVSLHPDSLFCILLWDGQSGAATRGCRGEAQEKTECITLMGPADRRQEAWPPRSAKWGSTRLVQREGRATALAFAVVSVGNRRQASEQFRAG